MDLTVIIPIRNRDKELEYYLEHMRPLLKSQDIIPNFIVVKQDYGLPFNKGVLCNIGFLEAEKTGYSKNYLFNDVDVLPNDKDLFDYTRVKKSDAFINPYGYTHCLGCFFMVRRKLFYKVNGFSNKYFGWGYEDADLEKRAKLYKISVDRENFVGRRQTSQIYDPSTNDDPQRVNRSLTTTKPTYEYVWFAKNTHKELKRIVKDDGLSSCQYRIISTENRSENDVVIYTVTFQ
jgi:beta-1,4-galactosyltransferase 4